MEQSGFKQEAGLGLTSSRTGAPLSHTEESPLPCSSPALSSPPGTQGSLRKEGNSHFSAEGDGHPKYSPESGVSL